MKFSFEWLKAHLETSASAEEIADKLTAIGLEVEALSNPAEALAPFVIARVITADKHPQADKLQVLTVDAGQGSVQVVCGAPNAHAGMLGVFGPPGAYIPGSDLTLKIATIRGVESHGMMCSVRELQLGDEHEGIIELADDAPVGAAFAAWAGLNDPVFDVNVTPNRQDCMGVRGIARDLAAAGMGTLKPLGVPQIEGSFSCPVPVSITDPEGCPAFFGRAIKGVTNGASPDWMQRRLKSAGQRPISALVDITNYVMLEHGRPAHAYDIARLKGGLTARAAEPGEKVLALNEKEYTLEPFMTVIADDAQVHDIGGIMGGEDSGVTAATTDVMLEVAYFTPQRISRTGQALGLTSDARSRFERGVDPAFLDDGLAILTGLILDICGGEASRAVRAGEPPVADKKVRFDPARTLSLGGLDVPAERQQAILESLGFEVANGEAGVPSWRRDVDGPADLVEEVARIAGYDAIPAVALPRAQGVARPTATRAQIAERQLRRMAASRGLEEAVNWSFISAEEAGQFGGAADVVANPISAEMSHMRPSLLPGLIAATRRNLDRGAASVRLFELGRRYLEEGERPTAALILSGEKNPRSWLLGKPQEFTAFDAKAEVLALLEVAGAPVQNLQLFMDAGPNWHPGRSAKLGLGPKNILAAFGELHPKIARGLPATVAAELYLDAIPQARSTGHARAQYAPPALQSVTRDFAFIVPADLAAEALVRAIRGADKQAITAVRVFDRYQPEGGDLSLAIEVVLQPGEQSFTEAEIAEIGKKVIAAAAKLGAKLRS